MPLTPRTKKYTDYNYLKTNPADEDAVRNQMDGAVDEVFTTINNEVVLKTDVSPVTTTITTGFASGWSGTIIVRKGLGNLCEFYADLTKTSDVVGNEIIFTLPVGLRSLSNRIILINLFDTGGSPISGALYNFTFFTTGNLTIANGAGTTTTNARRILWIGSAYYSA
jgi:hypothetical protein